MILKPVKKLVSWFMAAIVQESNKHSLITVISGLRFRRKSLSVMGIGVPRL